jgi:hypothetical protein
VCHQRRVLRRGDAVADAFGPQFPQRIPDRRRPGRLPRVRHAVQPCGDRFLEELPVGRPRHADLRSAHTEADETVGPAVERDAHRLLGGRNADLAREIEAPAQHQAQIAFGREPRVLDGLAVGLRADAARDMRIGSAGQFRVADVLRREILRHAIGQHANVFGVADEVDDAQIHAHEVCEIGEDEIVFQKILFDGYRGRALVARRELGDDAGGGGSDLVDVQFCLGQPGDEILHEHRPYSVIGRITESLTQPASAARSADRSRMWLGSGRILVWTRGTGSPPG